jgi:hypothetical protein
MRIRKFVVTCEDIREENGREVGRLVRRAVCSAVIANPLAGKPGADLAELEAMGAEISGQLAERALAALGVAAGDVTAYGKGAIVGTAGEIEHAAALIHPRFGAPVRKTVVNTSRCRSRTKTTFGRLMKWMPLMCGLLTRRTRTKLW